jgi:hypothetical protein
VKRALPAIAALLFASSAFAETAPHTVVDRVVVRFYAPETGGSAHPRFVTERTLAFETRLEQILDGTQGASEPYPEHDLRAALEHDVAEQMLASLAEKLVRDSPAANRPAPGELERVQADVAQALVERLGGRDRVDDAARAEQLDAAEVNALLQRSALAAWYLDRAVTPLLHPSEEQLRDVYRSSPHPYRGQPFEAVRAPLERWFVVERVRVAESAFLQAARSRVRILVTR